MDILKVKVNNEWVGIPAIKGDSTELDVASIAETEAIINYHGETFVAEFEPLIEDDQQIGLVSVDDASDIIDVYTSGIPVLLHTNIMGDYDAYFRLIEYVPAQTIDDTPVEAFGIFTSIRSPVINNKFIITDM